MADETRLSLLQEQPEDQEWLHEQDMQLQDVIQQRPDEVVQYIERKGLDKLGRFEVQDSLMLAALGEGTLLTFGSSHKHLPNPEHCWLEHLSGAVRRSRSGARRRANAEWRTNLPVEACVVGIRDAAGAEDRGILRPLLYRARVHSLPKEVFGLPAVQAVIHLKWELWARQLLVWELVFYLVWLLSYTGFVLLSQDEDVHASARQVVYSPRGAAQLAMLVACIVGMCPFLHVETCTIMEYGWGWVSTWNLLNTLTYVLQTLVTVLWVGRFWLDTQFVSTVMALQVILLWFRLQYFSRVFRPTKTAFVDTLKAVLSDTKWFLLFLTMLIFAFAVAFHILFRLDQDQEEFSNIWHSIVTVFAFIIGGFKYDIFWNSHNPEAATVLFVAFEFIMGIVLLNLLTAVLTNSMHKVNQGETLTFLQSKAAAIDELESTLPAWLIRRKAKAWFPEWVHVLRVDLPDAQGKQRQADGLAALASAQGAQGRSLARLLADNDALRKRLDDLEARLLARLDAALPPAPHDGANGGAARAPDANGGAAQNGGAVQRAVNGGAGPPAHPDSPTQWAQNGGMA